MEKRLYRKTKDRVFGGVCSGFSDYAQVDKGLLRFLTAIAILVTGIIPGLIAYILCVLLLPSEDEVFRDQMYQESMDDKTRPPSNPENTRMVIGIALILIGAITLARFLFDWVDFKYVFPAALVVLGAVLVFKNRGRVE